VVNVTEPLENANASPVTMVSLVNVMNVPTIVIIEESVILSVFLQEMLALFMINLGTP
jgi:hypothetical protein